MRYRVVVSRVQTAERYVRAADEAKAIEKVQEELDRAYGFLGGWTTVDTDLDVIEVENPYGGSLGVLSDDGKLLLSLKEAAKVLGLSYTRVYELVTGGEMAHVQIGTRRYVSRDQLSSFVDEHSRSGRHS